MPRAKAWKYKPTRFMAPDSHYDQARADLAVYFISNLKHGDGEFAGQSFGLLHWQEQIIRDVFGVIGADGYRQFRTAYIEIPKKNGKQLFIDTPIPTPDGYITMGDIRVGDAVFDERGKQCKVAAKSEMDYAEQDYRRFIVPRGGWNHESCE